MTELSASYRRCLKTGRLATRHYAIFLDAHPQIRAYFEGVDAKRHKTTLKSMHVALIAITRGDDLAMQYVRRLARRHGPEGMDIPRELYDCWLASLVRAVRECDPESSPAVERAWREAGQGAIDLLLGALATDDV